MLTSFLLLASFLAQIVTPDIISSEKVPTIDFPIKFAYVNKVLDWSSA